MKKNFKSLAALAILSAAAVLASCKKNDVELIQPAGKYSITIAPPSSEQTKLLATDDGLTAITIGGWEKGDVVTMVKQSGEDYIAANFTCTDPATGNFTAANLPNGINDVDDFEYAIFNALEKEIMFQGDGVCIRPKVVNSANFKDVIMMIAKKDGDGNYKMKVAGNMIKFNSEVEISVGVKIQDSGVLAIDRMGAMLSGGSLCPSFYLISKNDVFPFYIPPFTVPEGVSYMYLPPNADGLQFGLFKEDDAANEASVANFKQIGQSGILYTITILAPAPGGGGGAPGGGAGAGLDVDENSLSGLFSVSSEKKVRFSKGNLYYSNTGWHIEENQVDYHTWANFASCFKGFFYPNGTNEVEVGLFFWSSNTDVATCGNYFELAYMDGTTPSPSETLFTNQYSSPIGSDWFVLSSDEWHYLFEGRQNAGVGFGFANVCNQDGIVLLPDSFPDPRRNQSPTAFEGRFQSSETHKKSVYSEMGWAAMQAAGAVFLPAVGYRSANSASIEYLKTKACYWASDCTTDESKASCILIDESMELTHFDTDKSNACAIRLVTLAQ